MADAFVAAGEYREAALTGEHDVDLFGVTLAAYGVAFAETYLLLEVIGTGVEKFGEGFVTDEVTRAAFDFEACYTSYLSPSDADESLPALLASVEDASADFIHAVIGWLSDAAA